MCYPARPPLEGQSTRVIARASSHAEMTSRVSCLRLRLVSLEPAALEVDIHDSWINSPLRFVGVRTLPVSEARGHVHLHVSRFQT